MGLPGAGITSCDYLFIDLKVTLGGLEQSHNNIKQGTFAASGKSNKANATAFGNGKIEVIEYPWCFGCIAK